MKKILVASDHAGFALKEKVTHYLQQQKEYTVKDLGPYSQERCDYPRFAYALADAVSRKKASRGILICKSGIGNSIVANRVPGVRAALCYNVLAAQLSREHNDSNVLVLGSAFVKPARVGRIIKVWLETEFQGGRHRRRLNQIKGIERQIRSGAR
ncbi:MAG: ribose 5-phosphate isomerase B [Candidatus Omnitrophica bacterium]|nr:ribose 5-phosphate isomerase B [Candidatus Omnitrophota bacterium]